MSSEKHEMVCYNDECYICVYTKQKEERCCCFSLRELAKDCNNNTTIGKLFPVFIVDIEYLMMFLNLSILSIQHPDLALAYLCPDGKRYIKLIEVKRIYPDGNEEFKVEQIGKAIDNQLINFFYSEGIQLLRNKFSNVDQNSIKFVLVIPQNTYEGNKEISSPHELSKLLTKFNIDLRPTARKALTNGRVEVVPCIALDPSCFRP